jgi:hypothetical protein
MRRLVFLIAGSLVFWLVLALPIRILGGGDRAMIVSGTALLLCLVPATGTLLWAAWGLAKHPEQQLTIVLGGMGLRMFLVLGAGLLISRCIPYYEEQPSFWIWLLILYLFTLALEMGLILTGQPRKA